MDSEIKLYVGSEAIPEITLEKVRAFLLTQIEDESLLPNFIIQLKGEIRKKLQKLFPNIDFSKKPDKADKYLEGILEYLKNELAIIGIKDDEIVSMITCEEINYKVPERYGDRKLFEITDLYVRGKLRNQGIFTEMLRVGKEVMLSEYPDAIFAILTENIFVARVAIAHGAKPVKFTNLKSTVGREGIRQTRKSKGFLFTQ